MRRLLIEIVAGILAIVGFAFFERHRGAADCVADNKEAVHSQDVHNAEVHGEQSAIVQNEAKEFKDETSRPIVDAPVVRVCPRARTMPAPSSAAPVDHGDASLRGGNQEVPTVVDWDSRPVVRAGRDADAQIKQLQDYITNVCQKF
jgi:hypothetical protein